MLSIQRDEYFYEVRPRIVREGEATEIRIRPLDFHTAFEEGQTYRIVVIPLTSGLESPSRPPVFEVKTTCVNGQLSFVHAFPGEQEQSIRVYRESDDKQIVKTSVYSLKPDLFDRRPFLGDFHVHSCFSDGVESPEFVAAMYRQAGYDFLSITDHGRMDSSLRAIEAYRSVRIDMGIYPGEEVHPPHCCVHLVHFGGRFSVNELALAEITGHPWHDPGRPEWLESVRKRQEAFTETIPNVDPFFHASSLEAIDRIHEAGGMAILCHPFWLADVHNLTNELAAYYLKNHLVDAFELIGGQGNHENMLQVAFYQQLLSEGCQCPVVGDTDSHGTVDRVYFDQMKTMLFAKSKGKDDIMEAVRHQYSVAMDEYAGQEPRFYSSYRMVSYAMFLYEHYFPLYKELCYEEGRLMRAFVCGDPEAGDRLSRLSGRTEAYREGFFAKYD